MITHLRTKALFGRYDYDIEFARSSDGAISKVSVVYGDNGTGKTTLLKLLFHLLSPASNRGHRRQLTGIPFTRFQVIFSDGIKVSLERKAKALVGSYDIIFQRLGRKTLRGGMHLNEHGLITSATILRDGRKILEEISKLGLSVYLLRDDRRLESDEFPEDSDDRPTEYIDLGERFIRRRQRRVPQSRLSALRTTLDRTDTWLRKQAIEHSSRGEAEVQQIYASIARQVATFRKAKEDTDYDSKRVKLKRSLKMLEKRSDRLARFGLVSKINVKQLSQSLSAARTTAIPFAVQVVSSFIESQEARLDAFEDLGNRLDRFLTLINGFLQDKYVYLKVGEGLRVLTDEHSELEPENLSSGEIQLILLLCNVLLSSEGASLFIIDEPELSLNVKWQRRLIDTLLEITTGIHCQFFLASHSIELLARHKSQVTKLDPY